MEWRDEGVLLSVRRHGESAAIIEVFTAAHGRHAGLVHGGASRRMAATLQPGHQLDVTWRARLDDQLGTFAVEPLRPRVVLEDRLALAGLNAACAMLHLALPEREAHPALWHRTMQLLDGLGTEGFGADYLRWELRLLEEMGFALDLSRCAVTGSHDDLAFVSPRTGRAVARGAAGEWADRLLPLPPTLLGQGPAAPPHLTDGFRLTAHFLTRAFAPRDLPEARARLVDRLTRLASSPRQAD
ncbi:DNA repair protein RecO [Falsirhodobacter halotolerans]|uniref:DNA repair protein RecO n=1 Tax=Falsirhodobacter halotolerans TaxID=1146892 RepID=UPI001FD254AB|nr:DNA repair protein RecO [Falsirhodobacter halotolerans]MCJ8138486.1 DNA repair protein RecO [Falsirhodobacter halotolerans]